MVSVYGAGGYTGRLVLAELRRAGVPFVAVGRPSAGLREAATAAGCPSVEINLDEQQRLVEHFAQAQVVLACAGPFAETATPLLDAALAAGTHLLDLSGEPQHLTGTLSRAREVAARDIAVVHSVGFDVVPAELLASLCQRPLGALSLLELATGHTAPIASRGTLKSNLATVHSNSTGGLSSVSGALVAEPLGLHRKVISFPPPLGERACVSTGSAEVVLLSRWAPTRTFRHYLATLAPAALAFAEKKLPTYSADDIERALSYLDSHGISGPDAVARSGSHFALWCEATAESGARREMVMHGQDPYGLSAKLAVECALRTAEPGFRARGVLTPLQAYDRQPLLAALSHAGVRWSVRTQPL